MARGRKAPPPAREVGSWSPRERLIYRYHDGQAEVGADPLQLQRKLAAVAGFDEAVKMMQLETPGTEQAASQALDDVLAAVRSAFGVKSFAEGGLLDAECLDLLAHFVGFLGNLKKKRENSPTWPKPTGLESSGGGSDIRSGAASTSTEAASSVGGPSPS